MKALTFRNLREIQYEEVAEPVLQNPGDVIVEVSHTAICGSDLHIYHGRETGLDAGTVMGHEFAGRVLEAGTGVVKFKPGDQVVSPFTTSCGTCVYCLMGLTARCTEGQLFGWVQSGKGLQGAQAQKVRVPMADSTLVRIPEGMENEDALFAGDILATGYFCAENAGIRPGGIYALVGCGPVGLLAVQAAFYLGAEKVFAIDTLGYRLEIAASFGAIPLNATGKNPRKLLSEMNQQPPDAVMEAVGSPDATRLAFDLVRPGGTLSMVGVQTTMHFPFSPVEAYDKNIGFRIGRCPARHYMDILLPLVNDGKLTPGKIITHRLPLSEGRRGYEIFDKKEDHCIKVVLSP